MTPTQANLASWIAGTAENGHQNYFEELAILAENLLYIRAFGGPERVGHLPLSGSSVSAIDYMNDMSIPTFVASWSGMVVSASSASDSVTKTYFKPNSQISGATGLYSYDHDITIEFNNDAALINESGDSVDPRLARILVGSAVADASSAIAAVGAAVTDMVTIKGLLGDIFRDGASSGKETVDAFRDQNLAEAPSASLSLSAERFADALDVSGPVGHGGDDAPGVIAISVGNSSDTLVFGASGYDQHRADLQGSVDSILGNAGDDILVAGTGTGSFSNRNLLDGGDGNDILIGRTGFDELRGGEGNDLLIGGGRADIFRGGAGHDMISYANATTGVTLTRASKTGDAAGDEFHDVEIYAGSKYDDTLEGFTFGAILYGGNGNDTLIGHVGDTLIGGPGNDVYKLYTDEYRMLMQSGSSMGSLSPDQEPWYWIAESYQVTYDGDTIIGSQLWSRSARPLSVTIVGLEVGDLIYIDDVLNAGEQRNNTTDIANGYTYDNRNYAAVAPSAGISGYAGIAVSTGSNTSWIDYPQATHATYTEEHSISAWLDVTIWGYASGGGGLAPT